MLYQNKITSVLRILDFYQKPSTVQISYLNKKSGVMPLLMLINTYFFLSSS